MEIIFAGIQGGPFKPHVETGRASDPAFRFPFQTLDSFKPIADVIVGIKVFNADLVAKFFIFRLSNLVLLLRVYVWVVKKDGWYDAGINHSLDDLTLARSTA